MSPDSSTEVAHLRETTVESRPIYDGHLLHVREDSVRLADGHASRRELVEHRGAVGVVAIAADGRVVLVRQWRHAVAGALWEIPAGTLDHGEDPLACARRELREETGYVAERWRHLGAAPVSPGYSSELLHFFAAEGLTAGVSQMDHDERLDIELMEPSRITALLSHADTDLKTVAGVALAGILPPVETAP